MKPFDACRARSLLLRFAAQEAELQRLIEGERESLDDDAAARQTREPGDEADRAFAASWLAREGRMIEHYLERIDAIAAARERVEKGTFGICVECGEKIDPRRLGAELTAVRCAECQRRHEYSRALHH